jgi:hypothetical protein
MNHNQEPRSLKDVYTRRLGEFYFLLKHYEQIPMELWDVVCPLTPSTKSHSLPFKRALIHCCVWFFLSNDRYK